MFSCMNSIAVHVELIESMDALSCINALRRFFAVRGPAKKLWSDCGTNFVGANKELRIGSNQQDPGIQRYLIEQRCAWEFNPPHVSHMGGCWERMIGTARRILDSMLLQLSTCLTLYINGRSHFHHECATTCTCVYRARQPPDPLSIDASHTKDWSPTTSWRLLREGSVHKRVETSPSSCKPVLDTLATWVPTLLAHRQKWMTLRRDPQVGDVVLLIDKQAARNS